MKLNLPKEPPGSALTFEEPNFRPPLQTAGLYRSADQSAARRQAIMARLNEKRAELKAALRLRNAAPRLSG